MSSPTVVSVGQPWPQPLPSAGLLMQATVGSEGIGIVLVAVLDRPTNREVRFLTKERVRLGLLVRPPLVYVVLATDKLDLDAPYAIGLFDERHRAELVAAANRALTWPETRRGNVTIATVELAGQVTRGLRIITLSRSWMAALAEGLERCPAATPAERDRAMDETYALYPTPASMLRNCVVVEVGGAL